jgi:ATP-dependent helicase Lhr and Lhr-like helicase
MVRRPPDILITTPESLYLLLTSKARETLRDVHTVIIDEIHALAPTKRGSHLALSLERLEEEVRRGAAERQEALPGPAADRAVRHPTPAGGDRPVPGRPPAGLGAGRHRRDRQEHRRRSEHRR